MVVFSEKDRLQDVVLDARGVGRPPVLHRVPSSADFFEAMCSGLGWGMIPEPQFTGSDLVRAPGAKAVGVTIHWQRWRLDSAALEAISADVRRAAAAELRRPERL